MSWFPGDKPVSTFADTHPGTNYCYHGNAINAPGRIQESIGRGGGEFYECGS